MCSVAVVIPYYNGSAYIERAADSVLTQTKKPAEFVVVDDGSNTEEAAKLDDISSRMGFTVLRKENGGQGSARNFGVKHTQSQFICFLDQDDCFLEDHIEVLLAAVDRDDHLFGWVYGDACRKDDTGQIIQSSSVKEATKHPKLSIEDMIASDMFVLPSASLISRLAFETVGGFDPQFTGYEDDDLFLRIFEAGFTNQFLDRPVTVWYLNPNSTSFSILMCRSRFRYIKKLCTRFPDSPADRRFYVRDFISRRFSKQIIRDARRALTRHRTPHDVKMAMHKDELLQVMGDYIGIITSFSTISWAHRLALKMQGAVLRTQSTPLIELAFAVFKALSATRRIAKLRTD